VGSFLRGVRLQEATALCSVLVDFWRVVVLAWVGCRKQALIHRLRIGIPLVLLVAMMEVVLIHLQVSLSSLVEVLQLFGDLVRGVEMKLSNKGSANSFQSVKAGKITPRKKLAAQKKPRMIKSPGARSGLKKGAGG